MSLGATLVAGQACYFESRGFWKPASAQRSPMKVTSAVEKIIENTPLAFLVIGVILVVMCANRGLPYNLLQVNESGWRIFLGVIGAITAGLGCLSFWRERGLPTSPKQPLEGSDVKKKHET
jgi:hypothetical protein